MLDEITTPLMTGATPGHLGSKGLHNWIEENNPKLHICGHIHSAQGVLDGYGEVTTHINAACLGEDYKYSNANKYIEWEL
jgi:Icc-related predicted phosphoesterase